MISSPYVYKDYVSHSYCFGTAMMVDHQYRAILSQVIRENMLPTMKENGKNALKNIVDQYMSLGNVLGSLFN